MKPNKMKLVANMARHGTENEKLAAIAILDKFHLSLEDFEDDDQDIEVDFKYKTSFEKTLIFQAYARLLNRADIPYQQHSKKKILSLRVPQGKAEKLKLDIDCILRLWRKEIERFEIAFIHANKLFSNKSTGESSMSEQEVLDLLHMAASIKTATLDNLIKGR